MPPSVAPNNRRYFPDTHACAYRHGVLRGRDRTLLVHAILLDLIAMGEPAAKRCKVASEAVGPMELEAVEGGSQLRVSFTLPVEALQHAQQVRQITDTLTGSVSLPTSTSDVLSWLAVTLLPQTEAIRTRKAMQDALQEGAMRVRSLQQIA